MIGSGASGSDKKLCDMTLFGDDDWMFHLKV